MRRAFIGLATLLVLAACGEQPAGEPVVTVDLGGSGGEVVPVSAPPEPEAEPTPVPVDSACTPAVFEEIALTHCIADPAKHTIGVVYGPAGPAGEAAKAYGTLSTFAQSADAGTIAFAMNGGAFSDDLTPRGYLVVAGERLGELNRASGEGNFFMQPNGVFFGSSGQWNILATAQFLSTVRDRPQFGTQSGPMLLVGGKLADAINPNGNSRAIRNGVGIDSQGRAHFVISDAPLSFGQLARFFRDEAKARDALFLDANSSALWDPASGRMDNGRTGPIIVVQQKAAQ